jgi:hypothetical protein
MNTLDLIRLDNPPIYQKRLAVDLHIEFDLRPEIVMY